MNLQVLHISLEQYSRCILSMRMLEGREIAHLVLLASKDAVEWGFHYNY